MTVTMNEYKKTSARLGACGHGNRELEGAIACADKALEAPKAARERAVAQFRAEGVSFSVDEGKRKEVEAARLQERLAIKHAMCDCGCK